MSTQDAPLNTPRLSGLDALNARLRHERLLFVTETLEAHGHADPVSIAVLYGQPEDGPLKLGHVTLDGDTWHSVADLLQHDGSTAAALESVLVAMVHEEQSDDPERPQGHVTFLLPRPATTELAYTLSGHLYVPEGSVTSDPAPGQPLTVTLPGGQSFTVRAAVEGHSAEVQLLEGLASIQQTRIDHQPDS